MNFYELLKEGVNIAVCGNEKYTGALFTCENGVIYSENKHIGKYNGENLQEPASLNEHLTQMIKEGFELVIGCSRSEFQNHFELGFDD
jgi:hypothetical protein